MCERVEFKDDKFYPQLIYTGLLGQGKGTVPPIVSCPPIRLYMGTFLCPLGLTK
jgi:hypothetical protein